MLSHYLKNLPSQVDAFGQHSDLARAISDTVKERTEGCAIGLLGPWGSGKSTVIALLSETVTADNFDSSKRFATFIFDAWIHQGDPLRRAFLEGIATHLHDKDVFDKSYLKDFKAKLSTKEQKIDSKTQPVITGWGFITAIATLILLPLGIKLLPEQLDWFYWSFIASNGIALAMIFSPLAVLTICAFNLRTSVRDSEESFVDALSGLMFFNAQTIKQNVLAQERDKTSIEFKLHFENLMAKAEDQKLTVVIIVDNIDRLEPDQAKEAWSTMQTFFGHGDDSIANGKRNYFLIVPFAQRSIDSLFSTVIGANQDGQSEEFTITEDIIQKSFEIVFYVQPPIMTQWRKFFQKCIDEAFPEHLPNCKKAVADLFDSVPTPESSRRPREIKQFINRLVSLHRVHKEEFEVQTYALFELKRNEIEATPYRLTDPEFVSSYESQILNNKDWQIDLAALHYGTDKETAKQLLLKEPIRDALRKGEPDKLSNYTKVPGFLDVLFGVIVVEGYSWKGQQGEQFASAVYALTGISDQSILKGRNIWRQPCDSIKSITHWGTSYEIIPQCIQTLLKQVPEHNQHSLLANLVTCLGNYDVTKAAQQPGTRIGENLECDSWARACELVVSGRKDNVLLPIPDNSLFSIDVLYYLANSRINVEEFERVKLTSDTDSIRSSLIEAVNLNAINTDTYKLLSAPQFENEPDFWNPLIEAIINTVRSSDGLNNVFIAGCAELLFFAERDFPNSGVGNNLSEFTTHGILAHYLSKVKSSPNLAARLSIIILVKNPAITQASQTWQSADGFNIAIQIAANADEYASIINEIIEVANNSNLLSELVSVGLRHSNLYPLTKRMIEAGIERRLYLGISGDDLFECRHFFSTQLEKKTLHKLIDSSFVEFCLSRDFDLENSELYEWVLSAFEEESPKNYVNFLREGLYSLDSNSWLEAVNEPSPDSLSIISLVAKLGHLGFDITLGTHASTALNELCKVSLETESISEQQVENASTIFDALEPSHRTTVAATMLDRIINCENVNAVSLMIESFWRYFDETNAFVSEANRFVRNSLYLLASSDSESHVNLALRLVDEQKEMIKKARSSFKDVLLDKANERIRADDTPEKIKDLLRKLQEST